MPHGKKHGLYENIRLKKKRIATRNSNAQYQCMKVKAVVKDGKIISISNLD